MKRLRGVLGILATAVMLCSLCGCGSRNEDGQAVNMVEKGTAQTTGTQEIAAEATTEKATAEKTTTKATAEKATEKVTETQPVVQDAQAGEDLDVVEPDTGDDDWYKKGNIYTDDKGRNLEVFYDDDGMLQFAVDGLTLYDTMADKFQKENNWRIYTCNDGTIIVYYPGTPAHLEISDGEYAGLYEAGGDNVK